MQRARADSRERAGGGNRQEFLFWFSELYVAFICRSRPVPLLLGRGWCGGAVDTSRDYPRACPSPGRCGTAWLRGGVSQCLRAERRLIVREVQGCTDAGLVTLKSRFLSSLSQLKVDGSRGGMAQQINAMKREFRRPGADRMQTSRGTRRSLPPRVVAYDIACGLFSLRVVGLCSRWTTTTSGTRSRTKRPSSTRTAST